MVDLESILMIVVLYGLTDLIVWAIARSGASQ